MQVSENKQSGPLPIEKSLYLRNILEYLRWDRKKRYKEIASCIEENTDVLFRITSGRSTGTYNILDKIVNYCKQNNIKPPTNEERGEQNETFGIDYLLDSLDVTPEILKSSVSRATGQYLLFSLLKHGNVAVTWICLQGLSERVPLPTFHARRRGRDGLDINYDGYYYEHEATLFLFGHILDTAIPRAIFLVPDERAAKKDRKGVLSGASQVDGLFSAPCYLKHIEKDLDKSYIDQIIGDQTQVTLKKRYSSVLEYLQDHAGMVMAIPRSSG